MLHAASTTITTDGAGDATAYIGSVLTGRVHAIKYEPGDIYFRGDLTITGETTGVPILVQEDAGSADVWYYPRAVPNSHADGSAFTDIAADIHVLRERIKVVLGDGGDTATGTITVYIDAPMPY